MDEERVSSSLESVLRQLPALDLRGCRVVSFQAARAMYLRVRVVRALWNRLTTRERRALLYLLCVKSDGPSQASWWCQRSYAQALETIQLILSHLCSEEETRTLGTKTHAPQTSWRDERVPLASPGCLWRMGFSRRRGVVTPIPQEEG